MTEKLFLALEQERSVFRSFSSFRTIGNFEVFHSPNLEAIPHWNLAYPIDMDKPMPTASELRLLIEHYRELGVQGHLVVTEPGTSHSAAEESGYFALFGDIANDPTLAVQQISHRPENLSEFASVIQRCFSLSDQAIEYFRSKMIVLSEQKNSRFYVVAMKSEVVGCVSTFQTSDGSDFLFNWATLPHAERQGVGKSILAYAASKSSRPLYTYSHNPQARQIFERLGFEFLGSVYCVPLNKLKTQKKVET